MKIVQTYEEQLDAWVGGESTHYQGDDGPVCCPDFSCCDHTLLQPVQVRERFRASDEAARNRFLVTFLGALVRRGVHIVGEGS